MKKTSFFAGAAALALSAASIIPAVNAWAATTSYDNGVTTIPIKRTVTGVSNPVTNTFTYTITPVSSNPTGASNEPTTASIVFNNTTPVSGTATATGSIDFSGTTYSQIGDYYYDITETGSTDTSNYPIDDTQYQAQVSVRYAVDSTTNVPDNNSLVVTLAQLMVNSSDTEGTGDKDEAIWTSGANRTYVEINATTTGNSAETGNCFAYTVEIPVGNGVESGDTFAITSGTECTGGATSVTAGDSATIYLKHGDTATVGQNGTTNQLPIGASYTITKADTNDGYSTKINSIETTTVTKSAVAVDAEGFDDDNVINIENNKTVNPLTGIATNVWTYVIILAAGAAGVVYASKKTVKKEQ